ncbi:MAG: ORF2 protein [Psittacine adenovirus 12]
MSSKRWRLIESLMERGITSKALWKTIDPCEYRRYKKKTKRGWTVVDLLRDTTTHLPWSMTLKVYLIQGKVPRYIEGNSVYQVLEANDYCPRSVGSLILLWAERESARNTLWISGGPDTGADALVECLFYLAPIRSVADSRRENPFCRCTPSVLIWWNGGRIQEQHVGLVRQVFGGEHVIFPTLCWEEGLVKELYRTPVLASSDAMDIVVDARGLELDGYSPMLSSTMYRLNLTEKMPDLEITESDLQEFFSWVQCRPSPVNDNVHSLFNC